MQIVFDSSTLILLAKIDLLQQVAEDIKIFIPERIKEESTVKKTIDAVLISSLIDENKIEVVKLNMKVAVEKIQRDFGIAPGESEAICLAKSLNYPLATDDGLAIKACKIIGLNFITAIHFLLYFVSKNKLQKPIALEKLDKLSLYGRYSKRIIEDAIRRLKGGK